jgi:hypothetical protein
VKLKEQEKEFPRFDESKCPNVLVLNHASRLTDCSCGIKTNLGVAPNIGISCSDTKQKYPGRRADNIQIQSVLQFLVRNQTENGKPTTTRSAKIIDGSRIFFDEKFALILPMVNVEGCCLSLM